MLSLIHISRGSHWQHSLSAAKDQPAGVRHPPDPVSYTHLRENGILNVNTTYAADGLCTRTNLERSTETHAGDQVITTGLGGVVPPDLLVGTVQDGVPETSGKSSIAVVRPGADPRTAKHVFIVTAY